jgi:excinuclease ABC subunit C
MISQEFSKISKKLPDAPGIYLFKDSSGGILYIGKATSLRDRVKSYFGPDLLETRGRKLVDMVTLSADIDFVKTDSVLEALILEANLIRYHQPKYNTDEKDNKSWNYVVITNEEFPKVLTIRGRTLLSAADDSATPTSKKYIHVFGPFPYGGQLKEAMKIIRRIFPYRDERCIPAAEQRAAGRAIPRPCFNRQIGLCPGVCTGDITREEYGAQIERIALFFQGRKKELLKQLEHEMSAYAERQEFEKAGDIKGTLFALTHIQDIALLKREHKIGESGGGAFQTGDSGFRIEAYDIAHSSGKHSVGVMVVIEDGEPKKSDYRKFRIRFAEPKSQIGTKLPRAGNDIAALSEVLRRRLGHLEWPLPDLIVVDGGRPQMNAAKKILAERGFNSAVVAVVKDEHHKPREVLAGKNLAQKRLIELHQVSILLANAEAHRFAVRYHRLRRDNLRTTP